ncbi:MAG: ATP-binding protein [Oscillospiraceae bacterium]|nr:ATP-binding protein [Oscillospiraceae bacterium]
MFYGRQNELKLLNALYESGKFECIIMHGRHRSGKTGLIREFIADKRAIYYSAQETNAIDNLQNLIDRIAAYPTVTGNATNSLNSYEQAFDLANDISQKDRTILVIDDYQHLVASRRGISDLICNQIDKNLKTGKLMLIICGSSEPIMEEEALSYNSPFHGRRTAHINVMPFSFFETKRYYTGFSPFDIAIVYALTGGMPKYLEFMDPDLPIEDNIRNNFFDASSFLFEEPANILRQEVRDPTYYNAILRAIASGKTKNSEIAGSVGLETSACTAYLKNLIALGLVGKYTPVTEKAGRKTIYEIEDYMFRFWYRFVPANISLIKGGMADKVWRGVAREMPAYMGKVFEDICRQWLEQRNQAGRLPLKYVEMGRWWGIDPIWKTEVTLPIVAYADDDNAVFCDCVWSEDPAQAGALNSLLERSMTFRYANRYIYLFSRSGFSDECAETARRIGANLVMFE